MGTKRYPEEFRREAVELWRSSDRPRCRVAESLRISDGTLVAWIAEFEKRDAPGALSADEYRRGCGDSYAAQVFGSAASVSPA